MNDNNKTNYGNNTYYLFDNCRLDTFNNSFGLLQRVVQIISYYHYRYVVISLQSNWNGVTEYL